MTCADVKSPVAVLSELLAAPALHDEGVEAARNACVAGASLASAAITAAAYYGNPLTGTPALRMCMSRLARTAVSLDAWLRAFAPAAHPDTDDADFSPGFGFVHAAQRPALAEAAGRLRQALPGPRVELFVAQRARIEAALGPVNHAGLCALAFVDHGMSEDDAEHAYLLLRLPAALSAAQAARRAGLRNFPFFENAYRYEGAWPAPRSPADDAAFDLDQLAREVGLEL